MAKMFIGLHAKYRYSCPILMKLELSREIFGGKKYKFHENPSSNSRVVLRGQTDRRRDVTKIMVAFGNFAKAPKRIRYNFCCVKFSPHACATQFVRYRQLQTNKQMDTTHFIVQNKLHVSTFS
jgi:hypothetical protein